MWTKNDNNVIASWLLNSIFKEPIASIIYSIHPLQPTWNDLQECLFSKVSSLFGYLSALWLLLLDQGVRKIYLMPFSIVFHIIYNRINN